MERLIAETCTERELLCCDIYDVLILFQTYLDKESLKYRETYICTG